MKVLDKGFVELVDVLGDEKRIVEVARISYGITKEPDEATTKRLIITLLQKGHMSPFEQVSFTFKVKAPIFVARQWFRHRTGSYNELSRRYTKKNWEYYVPDLDRLPNKKISNTYLQSRIELEMDSQIRNYEDLIRLGVTPEIARLTMGVGFYTEFYFTMNLRNLLHFLELRTEEHSQYEIQEYANAIELLVEKELPNVIAIWRKKENDKTRN